MDVQTVCIPLADDGTIQGLLAQARSVAICKVDGDAVNDWREYIVGWDTTYGVDVPGVHHPRVIRFLQEHSVNVVVADQACAIMRTTLPALGISLRLGNTGDARSVVAFGDHHDHLDVQDGEPRRLDE